MITIVEICYRNYTHYSLYRSCLLIYEIAIVRSLSFLFLNDFEQNADISVAIKSSSRILLPLLPPINLVRVDISSGECNIDIERV